MFERTVPASDFARNFGRYRDAAASGEVVKVTSHGRVVGGYLSAKQLEEYLDLRQRQREAYRVEAMPEEAAAILEQALRKASARD